MEELAIHGGPKTKTTPFGKGQRFAGNELKYLKEALEQNTLFYWFGEKTKTMTRKFADLYGVEYCTATSSGTAAIHTALGAIGLTAGDEVITSPVTDMGTVIGILYQNAVPIFADLDPHSYNLDPASVESKITDKTKAILVVHLAGNAADMDPIMDIARRHHLYAVSYTHLDVYKRQGKSVQTGYRGNSLAAHVSSIHSFPTEGEYSSEAICVAKAPAMQRFFRMPVDSCRS